MLQQKPNRWVDFISHTMGETAKSSSAKQIFANWAQESSIAGLNNAAKAKSKIRMFIWAIIFAFFSIMTLNNLVNVISDFYKYPVTTSINVTHKSQVDFPAVTICNLNRSVSSYLHIWKRNNCNELQNPLYEHYENLFWLERKDRVSWNWWWGVKEKQKSISKNPYPFLWLLWLQYPGKLNAIISLIYTIRSPDYGMAISWPKNIE